MKAKNIIKTICFLMILAVVFCLTSEVLRKKNTGGVAEELVIDEVKHIKDDSLEVLVIGSSQVAYGYDAVWAYLQYGISSYGFGTSSQPMYMTYAWLKEINKKQSKINTVVIEVSMLYEQELESAYRKCLDTMPFSRDKIGYINKHFDTYTHDDISSKLSYYFTVGQYHERWEELTERDFTWYNNDNEHFRGCNKTKKVYNLKKPYETFVIDNDEPEGKEMVKEQYDGLIKCIQYCKDNNLNLVLIKTPKNSWSIDRHNGVQKIADEYGLDFIDFSTDKMLKAINFEYYGDLSDPDHLNAYGSEKLTSYLAEYLQSKYSYKDSRSAENDVEYRVKDYNRNRIKNELYKETDIKKYLNTVKNTGYDVIILSNKSVSGKDKAAHEEIINELGLDVKLKEDKKYSIYVRNGQVENAESASDNISLGGHFSDGTGFGINKDELVYGDKTKELKSSTITFVVYDPESSSLISVAGYKIKADAIVR